MEPLLFGLRDQICTAPRLSSKMLLPESLGCLNCVLQWWLYFLVHKPGGSLGLSAPFLICKAETARAWLPGPLKPQLWQRHRTAADLPPPIPGQLAFGVLRLPALGPGMSNSILPAFSQDAHDLSELFPRCQSTHGHSSPPSRSCLAWALVSE